jgi:hypothetical protein
LNIQYHGYLDGTREAYVNVEDQDYLIKKPTFEKFSYCSSNAKWFTEAIEYFAYKEIIEKGISDNEYFEKISK